MQAEKLSIADVAYAVALALASLIAYLVDTYALASFVDHANNLLGGMWATVATIYVFKQAREQRLRAGIGRFFATSVSFVLTLVYLVFLPFSPVGMAGVIGIGTLLVIGLGRRDDVTLTAITTTVIMVVAAVGPTSAGWAIPLLRLGDTVIGIVVGLGFWWLLTMLFHPNMLQTSQRPPERV